MTNREYREFLINGILEFQTKGNLTRETLQKYSIRTLEKVYDHIQYKRGKKRERFCHLVYYMVYRRIERKTDAREREHGGGT